MRQPQPAGPVGREPVGISGRVVAVSVTLALLGGLVLFAGAYWVAHRGVPAVIGPAPLPTSGRVIGATFAPSDDTYTMQFQPLGFNFRTPSDWDCARFDAPPAVAYRCIGGDPLIGGRVLEVACAAPCSDAVQQRMRSNLPDSLVAPSWRQLDTSTWYAERRSVGADGVSRYTLLMSHFWRPAGGPADVVVQLTAPAAQAALVQRVANDIRAATP